MRFIIIVISIFIASICFAQNGLVENKGGLQIEHSLSLGQLSTSERLSYTPSSNGTFIFDSDVNLVYVYYQSNWYPLSVAPSESLSFSDGDVAMIGVAGQSNAEGVATNPDDAEVFTSSNIFVMQAGARVWTPYTNSNNNVYRTFASDKPNPLNALAKGWQDRINAGENLPDLYILNVSRGGQAFSFHEANCRWNPFAWKQNKIGTWNDPVSGVVDLDVSLFKLFRDALMAGVEELQSDGKRVIYMGTIWAHWNQDNVTISAANQYLANLSLLRSMIDSALGIEDSNFFYFFPTSNGNIGKPIIISAFENYQATYKNVFQIRLSDAPNYTGVAPDYGVFISDNIHINLPTYTFLSSDILTKMLDGGFIGKVAGNQN